MKTLLANGEVRRRENERDLHHFFQAPHFIVSLNLHTLSITIHKLKDDTHDMVGGEGRTEVKW